MMRRTIPILLLIVLGMGCGAGLQSLLKKPCASNPEAQMLFLGDSILAFHGPKCQSIVDRAAGELGLTAHSMAQTGARLLPGPNWMFGDIREQYLTGAWEWVVIEGGINDVNNACDCGDCDDVLENLATVDGSNGAVPELVKRAQSDGAKVAILGYYDIDPEAGKGFGSCVNTVRDLNARYAAVAAAHENTIFVDIGHINPVDDPDTYLDGVHPTVTGAERVGRLLADAIRRTGEQPQR